MLQKKNRPVVTRRPAKLLARGSAAYFGDHHQHTCADVFISSMVAPDEGRVNCATMKLMLITFRPLDRTAADGIRSWHYEAPYDFYDMSEDLGDLDEFYAPSRWGVSLFGAYDEENLVGFADLIPHDDVIELGLGLRPDLTGRRLGLDFVNAILEFGTKHTPVREFRLDVAQFNERAIRVYERAGFTRTREYLRETNGGLWPFIEMTRPA